MKEIIQKLNELVNDFELKVAECNQKEKELSSIIATNKEVARKNEEYNKEISDREKNVSHVENILKISEESKERFNQASDIRIENEKRAKELDAKEKELNDGFKELHNTTSLYRSKNQHLANEKIQLEKDRKEMRANILKELLKT